MFDRGMRDLILFSSPVILSRMMQTLGLVTGNIFVAQLSLAALAASALTTTFSLVLLTFASGCLLSFGPLFSRLRDQKREAKKALLQGFVLATLLGFFIIILFLKAGSLLQLAGQSQALVTMVQPYFYALCFAVLPMLWTTLIQQYGLAKRLEKLVLIHSIFRLLLGVGCNYVFIFGIHLNGFSIPAMEFTGLGIGVSVASWIGCIVLFFWVVKRQKWKGKTASGLGLFIETDKKICLVQQLNDFFRLCKTCIPAGLQFTLEMMVLMMVTLFIGQFGHSALGAWQVVSQYLMLFTMLPFGISQAVAILAGNYLAERAENKKNPALRYLSYRALVLALACAGFCGVVYLLFPDTLRDIYLWRHKDIKEALPLLPAFFALMAIYQCLDSIRLVAIGVLRGYLASFRVFVISLFAFAGVSLLTGNFLVTGLHWRAEGIITGLLSGMLLATVLTWLQKELIVKRNMA